MNTDVRDVLQVAFRVLVDRIEDLTEEVVQAQAETVEAEEKVEALEERVALLTAGPDAVERAAAEADRIVRGLTGEPVAHREVLEELGWPDPRYDVCPPCQKCGLPVAMDGSCWCDEPASRTQAATEIAKALADHEFDPAEEVSALEHALKETKQRLADSEASLAVSRERCRGLEKRLVEGRPTAVEEVPAGQPAPAAEATGQPAPAAEATGPVAP